MHEETRTLHLLRGRWSLLDAPHYHVWSKQQHGMAMIGSVSIDLSKINKIDKMVVQYNGGIDNIVVSMQYWHNIIFWMKFSAFLTKNVINRNNLVQLQIIILTLTI